MSLKANKGIIVGMLVGISVAVLAIILAGLNDRWDNEALRTAINFLSGIPILIFSTKLNIPEALVNVSFFVYWIVLGGVIGWLAAGKKALSKIALILLIVAVIVSHRFVQTKLERDIEAALEALGSLFKGEATLEK